MALCGESTNLRAVRLRSHFRAKVGTLAGVRGCHIFSLFFYCLILLLDSFSCRFGIEHVFGWPCPVLVILLAQPARDSFTTCKAFSAFSHYVFAPRYTTYPRFATHAPSAIILTLLFSYCPPRYTSCHRTQTRKPRLQRN